MSIKPFAFDLRHHIYIYIYRCDNSSSLQRVIDCVGRSRLASCRRSAPACTPLIEERVNLHHGLLLPDMNPTLYKAAQKGSLEDLKLLMKQDSDDLLILSSVTPQGNTALHIAARLGHRDFAEELLANCSDLLPKRNVDGDTPLHMASRSGHLRVVVTLINYAMTTGDWPSDRETGEGLLRMVNNQDNTALHEAVRRQNRDVAMKLVRDDPEVAYMSNLKRETPLHVAAKEGLGEVVREILCHLSERTEEWTPPPGTPTPLHHAVLGGHMGIVELILGERKSLLTIKDGSGRTALHYAADRNEGKIVEFLLRKDSSLAYLTDNGGLSPLHVAAASNSTTAIKEILRCCPDAAEQLDSWGRNALHVSILNGAVAALICLLKAVELVEIVNKPDTDGNTPLHLAADKKRIRSSLVLLKDKRVDSTAVNNQGKTARELIKDRTEGDMDTYEMFVWRSLIKRESQQGQKPQFQSSSSLRTPRKLNIRDEHFKASAETYTLVSALIATVTFAAIFTMPGGFRNDDDKSQDMGSAIFVHHAAFKAFVIADTVAMCSSLVVVFCFIWAWKDPVRFKLNQLKWGHRLTVVACLAMLLSLMTAVYVVVAKDCLWLAIVVCIICCSTPFLVWAILGHDVVFVPV